MASKYKEVERTRGKPMKQIFQELYAQYGNLQEVADDLGISQGTASNWLIRAGLEVRYTLVEAGQADQHAAHA